MNAQEAERYLAQVPGYTWLIDSKRPMWTTAEIAESIGVHANTIRRWAEQGSFPGAADFGGAGWRIPRDSLLVFLASRVKSQAEQTG